MANFWKAASRIAALAIGAKVITELVKCCRKSQQCPETKPTVDLTGAKYIPNQVVVWKRPGVSDATFADWKRKNKPSGISEVKLCKYCDDSLELWQGDNISTLISGQGATQQIPPGGGGLSGGGDDVAYYSYNLIIDLPEPGICFQEYESKCFEYPEQLNSNEPPIIVAVFDTGLDENLKKVYTTPVYSCMPGGSLGWNFVENNDDTKDDHPSKHGSAVSKFIIDQAIKWKKHRINIIPVKVHNSLGKSDLFSILCGFAYAANCGAKIVNASFGFYASKNSRPPAILAEFVKKHLTDKNIILVAAAGNVNGDRSFVPVNEIEEIRNLDTNPFYPGCLSNEFDNVLTVTTTSSAKDKVSPSQNFSKTIVNLGVKCDSEIAGDFRFEDSLERVDKSGNPVFILGSSYATPIITGILAQHYEEFLSSMINGSINRENFIQNLQSRVPGLISPGISPLDTLIKNANCCEK